MKNKLLWHQVVLVGVLVILTGLRLLMRRWFLGLDILWWWLGGVLGFLFVFFDRFVDILITNPKAALSLKVKDLFGANQFLSGLSTTLTERADQKNLIMRSALFMSAWVVIGIWTMTSVANYFSRGLVLGIGTHLVFDLWWDYSDNKGKANEWFWQIKRTLSANEIKGFVYFMFGAYLLISWFI